LDLIHTQEEYAKLKKVVSTLHFGAGPYLSLLVLQVGAGAKGDQSKQIEELKKKLAASEAKDRDFGAFIALCRCFVSKLKIRPSATLKKQAAQQAAEFDRLASKYNEATGAVSDKKSD
jgi:predicted aminopeptidase